MAEKDTRDLSEKELETSEWLESLDYVLQNEGHERARELLKALQEHAYSAGVRFSFTANTPYRNTIPVNEQPVYPGNRELERRIKSIIRWNAMAMVVRAQRGDTHVGGHISSYASSATLYEVGYNHFFKARTPDYAGDAIYIQGHTAPGHYSRAFLEGRISREQIENFRRELQKEGGLPSYPHPRLMQDFWQYPTVSMGLGPILAIYHARFTRYLEDRGLKPRNGGKIWAFLGDGETDEPETLGAIGMAAREKLDNLIFVVNCNLQRLDGPVRGNFKIIQELESIFRGAGWNVIKVIWGSKWDPLFEKDSHGLLQKRGGEAVDGDFQKYSVAGGKYIREHFFGKYPELFKLVEHFSDEDLAKLNRGGHDPEKVYAAYKSALEMTGAPTVILAKTVKGYGMGEAGEGKNVSHQQKKLNEEELKEFRNRFNIPISDQDIAEAPLYCPPENSLERQYLKASRNKLGGYLPFRNPTCARLKTPEETLFEEFYKDSGEREVSTTMVMVRLFSKLLKDQEIGKYIVPIIPDEARTFGLESLFRTIGIYSSVGQLYEPVDKNSLLYYKESKDGQILEEGINEAGAMSSFMAAGNAYANYGIPTIPFFFYYSMFGFQRIGDLAWAAGDMMCRGFMLGCTAGRTTLNGEGLQHQDGHSHVLASTIPNIVTYDPAFSYEIAVIVREGIRRMYEQQENIFYYITLGNENYQMPEMPENSKEGILKGIYKLKKGKKNAEVHLLGSGSIINGVLDAQKILETYNVSADVWSVTSYNELRREALEVERWNLLNPDKKQKQPYLTSLLEKEKGVFVAASDYMKILPDSLAKWIPGTFLSLGTDGFGLSETREALREHFEVDARTIALAALTGLAKDGKLEKSAVKKAFKELKINPDKRNPMK
ncbi:pyruvate dehydrogenase (acetyl-transferring), homodimeric type [Deltaproteobacteria bacterium TL4]